MNHNQTGTVETNDDKKPDRPKWEPLAVWAYRLTNVARWIWHLAKNSE